MAESKKTTKEYYPHYYGERNTPKMIRLFMALNMEGVGIYTYLKEKIAENGGEMSLDDLPAIAFEFRIDTPDGIKKLERIIREFGLFEVDEENNTFCAPEIQENIKFRAEVSEKRREAGKASHRKNGSGDTESAGEPAGNVDEETGEILKPPVDTKKLSAQIQEFLRKFPEVKFDCNSATLKTLDMEKLTSYAETRKMLGTLTRGYSLIVLLDEFKRNISG